MKPQLREVPKPVADPAAQGKTMIGNVTITAGEQYYAVLKRDEKRRNSEILMVAARVRGALVLCTIKNGKPSGSFELSAFAVARPVPKRF